MKTVITERANGNRRVQLFCEGETRTEQAHKGATNINNIIAKYRRTGFIKQRCDPPTYGDFTTSTDYHDIKNRIMKAEGDFMRLPAELRNKFDNDAGKLLDFIDNPENASEAVVLGLIDKIAADVVEEPESTPEAPVEPTIEPPEEPA